MTGLSCAVLLLSSPAKNVDDLLYSPTHLRWTSRGVDLLSVLTNFDASRHASSPPSPMVHLVQVVEVAQTQRVSETTNKICLTRCVCPYQTLQECSTAFFYCLSVTVLSALCCSCRRHIALPVHNALGFASALETYAVRTGADFRPMTSVANSCTSQLL